MERTKVKALLFLFVFITSFSFCEDVKKKVVASTSWTASFVELSGWDDVAVIAPSNLRHPPEYEITVRDVLNIKDSDFFIYAGFERMMKTLKESFSESSTIPIQIKCDNSLSTVKESARKIAHFLGTETECEERLAEYEEVLKKGREIVTSLNMAKSKVYCHKHQQFLAKEIGLNVVDTFGPGPVTSKDILKAKEGDYDFIIDNIHNPVGEPLKEVNEKAKYIIWRNFPDTVGDNSLIKMVEENIEKIY